ncbi:WD40 repeat-like protein [Suillus decipiens]|nr:WD40 repeat-like protein [Suillus decipiens]
MSKNTNQSNLTSTGRIHNEVLKIPEYQEKLDPNQVASWIKHVNSFVKLAVARASKQPTDDALSLLLARIRAVDEEMQKPTNISSIRIYGKMVRQILECTDFIINYSEIKNFWKRVGKYVSEETPATIQKHKDVLDNLIKDFQNSTARDTSLYRMDGDLDFSDMVYAAGAGLDISKCCLPDTRKKILSEIKSWVCDPGKHVPCVMWLSGDAYTGKSAIAHTIMKWYTELGGLGACFCFDRTRGAERRHEKIFSTIARDLADCDPFVRRALADAFHHDNTLRQTTDIKEQWQKLIIRPVNEARKTFLFPLLIVIDGLNESGEEDFPEQFLGLLHGEPNASSSQPILEKYRILITSRRPKRIRDLDTVSYVKHVSLNNYPTEGDIPFYFSIKLPDLRPKLDNEHVKKQLFHISGGLFEWASLACKYINRATRMGKDRMARFEHVVRVDGTSGKETYAFDSMYRLILEDITPKDDRGQFISRFRSVMRQIIASQEPLSMAALTAMRWQFPGTHDHYDVDQVIGSLDSFFTGTRDSQTAICPVHPSFYEFLTVSSRSQKFFVDVSPVAQLDLAFASLRIMEKGLRFNICDLETSYLPNSAVPNLQKRVEKSIPAELSYSCRFWGTHVQAASFGRTLAQEVEAFFNGERLLFWVEALALMGSLSSSRESLSSIANWFKYHDEYVHIGDAATNTRDKFIRTFETVILHSTPHLYLSVLPFTPPESAVYKIFVKHFPRTARVISGHDIASPQILRSGNANVMSVAVSSAGKLIVCGLDDGTIWVWDRVAGKKLDSLSKGHAGAVRSVAISPDGKTIVSGSNDATIQVWNVGSGSVSTLKGHTGAVRSVVISSNGERVVSGSDDKTIRVWNPKTREAIGAPLQGHTAFVQSVQLNGNRIFSGSADNTIRIWDVKTGKELGAPIQGHTDWVQSVALSPDGNLIVSGSRDKTIRVWNAKTRRSYCAPLQGHADDVLSVAISPDEKHIVSGSADNTVRVWDVESSGVFRAPLQLAKHRDYVRSVAISPDGQYVTSGSDDKEIRVWDKALQAPASFSSNLASLLSPSSSVIQDSRRIAYLKDGWIINPEGQLLLWIPPDRNPSVANNMLLISDGSSQLDLNNFPHGKSWHRCREQVNYDLSHSLRTGHML